jgi:hypothetical protein
MSTEKNRFAVIEEERQELASLLAKGFLAGRPETLEGAPIVAMYARMKPELQHNLTLAKVMSTRARTTTERIHTSFNVNTDQAHVAVVFSIVEKILQLDAETARLVADQQKPATV